jgi:hypothetical protein
MKKLFAFIMVIILTLSSFAQSPAVMSYQCVIRNASGVLVTNQSVGMRISILQGSASGSVVYQEIFNPDPQTNANGLLSLGIGGGIPVTGTFAGINWATGPYFLKTETDPTGGTTYTIIGTTQLLSVPYALFSNMTTDLADNSVTSAKIVNSTIANADLADGSISSSKILDASVATSDIANGAVTAVKIGSSGASTNNVLQYNGSSVAWGYAPGSEVSYSVINVACASLASFSSTYVKLADLGTFNKLDATSKIEATYNGRITANTISGTGAHFELRIDENPTSNGRARANIRAADAGGNGVPVSICGIFTGLNTGSHTVSMWVRGATSGTTAMVDPGCWTDDYVIVREIK